LESLGIKQDEDILNTVDKCQVQLFNQNMIFKDNHYHVSLPWYEDKIELVPNNFKISLNIANRVFNKLTQNNLISKYNKVFEDQLNDKIIEKVNINFNDASDISKYKFIPHRPIIRQTEQVTTKIRPVFNCSLKSNKTLPSLNEAAYSGYDLMNSLLKLLLVFRTNRTVVISDVKQAFLMIRLKDEVDMNRFTFLWFNNGQLEAYRYLTLIFGFTSSPFILHYIMKYHASKYPHDRCTEILSSGFYVDNLIFTSMQEESEIVGIYHQCKKRMEEGGFILRSWNSNSDALRVKFKEENSFVEHSSCCEKILGYSFNVVTDCMHINKVEYLESISTKRQLLSEISKLFDPLNFALPILVRGKLLMRQVWQQKLAWDQKVPNEILKEWYKIRSNCENLDTIAIPRRALSEGNKYGLHLFCDSSDSVYGFVCYGVDDDNKSSFIFAKAKVAPANRPRELSIPSLELMGVILALKCLPNILEAYSNIYFEFINIAVDSQVVLSWLLTRQTKVKSKFLKNRINEMDGLITSISKKYKVNVYYKYVNTAENPGDFLTRGLTFKKFKEIFALWYHGPVWLTNDLDNWPKYPMLSVPQESLPLLMVNVNILENTCISILDLSKYSCYRKVLRITAWIFKWLSKIKVNVDYQQKSVRYWLKINQIQSFDNEIKFLKDYKQKVKVTSLKDSDIPPLFLNLNLFLDEKGYLRSKGRINKALLISYEQANPILMGRNHGFT
ncbi:MAG TPA: A17 family peptidase, partial [Rummeliibacillus sp.]|nr:A17 family peptidase [Rummeliibacillus sp.]